MRMAAVLCMVIVDAKDMDMDGVALPTAACAQLGVMVDGPLGPAEQTTI